MILIWGIAITEAKPCITACRRDVLRQRTPEAIGGLVAALGDEDAQRRWLAAPSLQGIGGGTVIATLTAFID